MFCTSFLMASLKNACAETSKLYVFPSVFPCFHTGMREQKPLNAKLSVCFRMLSHRNARTETTKLYVFNMFCNVSSRERVSGNF